VGDGLEIRLRRIQEEFVKTLPGRITEVLDVWDADLADAERLKRAHHLIHRLSGGAGTLGQADLSVASKALELDIQALLELPQEIDLSTRASLRARTQGLLDCIRNPA
jgi:HPt (histidine-containing phosphotransfer) domain-containing protein